MSSQLRRVAGSIAALSCLAVSSWSMAGPIGIDYELIATGGAGQYEYRYTVSNDSLAVPLAWFSIDFDPGVYDAGSLRVASSGTADWSEQILSPVLGNPAQYDVYNVVGRGLNPGETASGFAVDFSPGSARAHPAARPSPSTTPTPWTYSPAG